ncbi:MAG: hydrogenase formation protein HypD [Zetaproteobacteria bacterium CG06_land_8_20_14_3_00_59_53]|nr:MAG: hydrogenase formation protein HypD [Zetaproteobacteria bacterium CG2_30_59_37]PIO90566.1 MAG: hydrogenase formation protein HypD [Zetaproteobacteria bacterium CG23_combo_of_CG06-09_8_20_14_all_59_86]PIQ66166.1 MAG: hydrogenase formation protein HypD [Zetaproteobacteria bacterium CG11_big_fil_rev_8_21_14_0_20_59_439]PIU71514.1 MAG: hydrogenase formation protein HypD [Zetaproteobacteria bacterium CG06_land_8_20_14_3_00_59_53]PIU97773.1 MAG: hydrogenase formation protein HypD [Zetaproteoba
MKYLDEFRDGATARALAATIRNEALTGREYRLMEFCGGHTHAIFRYGIKDLMPANLRFVHGPGCPVCVLPAGRIEAAIKLVEEHQVILCTYADLMRVPAGKKDSLHKAKARGGDIRMIYSATDALGIAQANPDRQVVFFAIGFETTTPPTAAVLKIAHAMELKNFSVYCNHVLTPPAMAHILDSAETQIDGILGPSHVSSVIGSCAYASCCKQYKTPIVIAGFEPLDVLASTLMLLRQINTGRHEVENQYTRVVSSTGNEKAQALMRDTLVMRALFEWRGLGRLPDSAMQIRGTYADLDAEKRFAMQDIEVAENKGCICPAVLRGVSDPDACKLFGTVCTPEDPKGACMVSSEGACAAYYSYGRRRA